MVPLSAGANDSEIVDKTSSGWNTNKDGTTVTLEVNGSAGVPDKAAVLFVFDKSTSVNVRDAATSFADELALKVNTDLKVAVIDFSSVAASSGWVEWDSSNPDYSIFYNTQGSGTNYHAGLLKAQELLTDSAINGYTPYFITVSDGITYIWNEDVNNDGIMEAATILSADENNSAAGNSYQNGVDTWDMKHEPGSGFNNTVYGSIEGFLSQANTLYSNTRQYMLDYSGARQAGNVIIRTNSYDSEPKGYTVGYSVIQEDGTWSEITKTDAQYMVAPEAAVYKTVEAFNNVKNIMNARGASNNIFVLGCEELNANNWVSWPFGKDLMDYMASLTPSDVDNAGMTNDTAGQVFANIEDELFFSLNSGVVNDIIGTYFNLDTQSPLTLNVDGTTYTGTLTNNQVSFDNGNYVVTYTPGTSGSANEKLVWNINVPVTGTITLSYSLDLDQSAVAAAGTNLPNQIPTNEEATLTYSSSDGGNMTEEFPKPYLPISGESGESSDNEDDNPPIVIPDNPSLTIRKIWENDSASDRPDSITVDIYHDGEYYDSMVISGRRFGDSDTWRDSYDIPARYEDDDWWVVESDVPAYYDSDVEEIRENVFYITNTYEEPVIEEPVSSEPESSEPSSEPSEVIPSGPSEEPSAPSSEPTSEPSEPAEPTLPQTGQTWWPIIILLAGGAVLVAFGAFRTMRGSRRHDR